MRPHARERRGDDGPGAPGVTREKCGAGSQSFSGGAVFAGRPRRVFKQSDRLDTPTEADQGFGFTDTTLGVDASLVEPASWKRAWASATRPLASNRRADSTSTRACSAGPRPASSRKVS
jgi:hypothetical protein